MNGIGNCALTVEIMHIKRCLSVKISQNRHFSLSWKPPVRRCLCICTCIVTVTLNWSGHMQKVAATSLLSLGSPTSPPQQHPLCSAGNVIKPWGNYQWCVVHNFLLSNCLGKPLPVLIDKVRPTGTVGGVPFWTVLNWCPVLLFSSLWTCDLCRNLLRRAWEVWPLRPITEGCLD